MKQSKFLAVELTLDIIVAVCVELVSAHRPREIGLVFLLRIGKESFSEFPEIFGQPIFETICPLNYNVNQMLETDAMIGHDCIMNFFFFSRICLLHLGRRRSLSLRPSRVCHHLLPLLHDDALLPQQNLTTGETTFFLRNNQYKRVDKVNSNDLRLKLIFLQLSQLPQKYYQLQT